MKSFYTTEQALLSSNIEKPDANKHCSAITVEDPIHSYRVGQKTSTNMFRLCMNQHTK